MEQQLSAINNLSVLLQSLSPKLLEPTYVYCMISSATTIDWPSLSPLGTFREDEGLTLILDRDAAEKAGLAYGPAMRCITLTVHSALDAVGLTAAVATALAEQAISANVVAAYHHDHILVPAGDAEQALAVLRALAAAQPST